MTTHTTDIISVEQAGSLAGLFRERVRRSPDATAYVQYQESSGHWQEYTWQQMAERVAQWQLGLQQEELAAGDRVAVMLRNCIEWVLFDQAALGLGLVVVPMYTSDRPENLGYILQHSGARLLLLENQEQWRKLENIQDQLTGLTRIITLKPITPGVPQVTDLDNWLAGDSGQLITKDVGLDALATIVYTSGTTGRSKGVMLSHRNILWNAWSAFQHVYFYPDDRLLSFLPLSHTFERTVGYYAAIMAGAGVAYARSVPQLAEDLLTIKPTIMVSVPRIFERIHDKIQAKLETDPAIARYLFTKAVDTGWKRFLHRQKHGPWSPQLLLWPLFDRLVASKVKAKLGGNLRYTVSGGAALSPAVARLFIGLDITILQGYGLTETSPIITANTLEENIPESVGMALDGVEIKIGDGDELLTRSPSIMLGYWDNPEATARIIDQAGWLHTGDKARIQGKHVFITGRMKDIIVLANGEKVPPADMEMAISLDGLFEQVLIIGEGKPYLSALMVLNPEQYKALAESMQLDPNDPLTRDSEPLKQHLTDRVATLLHSFPGYAKVVKLCLLEEPWSIDNGLMTPTMKLRRGRILERYAAEVEKLYEGH